MLILPLLTSRFLAIRFLASSAEAANSRPFITTGDFGLVMEGDGVEMFEELDDVVVTSSLRLGGVAGGVDDVTTGAGVTTVFGRS